MLSIFTTTAVALSWAAFGCGSPVRGATGGRVVVVVAGTVVDVVGAAFGFECPPHDARIVAPAATAAIVAVRVRARAFRDFSLDNIRSVPSQLSKSLYTFAEGEPSRVALGGATGVGKPQVRHRRG
jgi:hypothetical protein